MRKIKVSSRVCVRLFRPHRTQHRCGLLLPMLHVPWSVHLFVCWTLQKNWLDRKLSRFQSVDSCRSKEGTTY